MVIGGICWRYFFFFFQAEDGIRDKLVTGVQTCALPILDRLGIGMVARLEQRAVDADPLRRDVHARLAALRREPFDPGGQRDRTGRRRAPAAGLAGRSGAPHERELFSTETPLSSRRSRSASLRRSDYNADRHDAHPPAHYAHRPDGHDAHRAPARDAVPGGGRGERQTPEPPAAVGRKRRLPRMALPRMAFMSPELRESSG